MVVAIDQKDHIMRSDWDPIIARAAEIVRSYSTGVTLRQLFYRLVAAQILPNTPSAYKTLSSKTAEARRARSFPRLIDRTRIIHREASWTSPRSILDAVVQSYKRDRTDGQECQVYIGVEKAGLVNQLESWFGGFGIPILALSGYSSQSFVDDVVEAVARDGRPAALLYGGDFDPSGEDIDRDFEDRTGCFTEVIRVALSAEQVTAYDLPPAMGKSTDSRASAFFERHGVLVQVELDALAPDDLQALFLQALDLYWDQAAYDGVLSREATERTALTEFVGNWSDPA